MQYIEQAYLKILLSTKNKTKTKQKLVHYLKNDYVFIIHLFPALHILIIVNLSHNKKDKLELGRHIDKIDIINYITEISKHNLC